MGVGDEVLGEEGVTSTAREEVDRRLPGHLRRSPAGWKRDDDP
jgi:hypothetical protein